MFFSFDADFHESCLLLPNFSEPEYLSRTLSTFPTARSCCNALTEVLRLNKGLDLLLIKSVRVRQS
jgi:hypothetical protein